MSDTERSAWGGQARGCPAAGAPEQARKGGGEGEQVLVNVAYQAQGDLRNPRSNVLRCEIKMQGSTISAHLGPGTRSFFLIAQKCVLSGSEQAGVATSVDVVFSWRVCGLESNGRNHHGSMPSVLLRRLVIKCEKTHSQCQRNGSSHQDSAFQSSSFALRCPSMTQEHRCRRRRRVEPKPTAQRRPDEEDSGGRWISAESMMST